MGVSEASPPGLCPFPAQGLAVGRERDWDTETAVTSVKAELCAISCLGAIPVTIGSL